MRRTDSAWKHARSRVTGAAHRGRRRHRLDDTTVQNATTAHSDEQYMTDTTPQREPKREDPEGRHLAFITALIKSSRRAATTDRRRYGPAARRGGAPVPKERRTVVHADSPLVASTSAVQVHSSVGAVQATGGRASVVMNYHGRSGSSIGSRPS